MPAWINQTCPGTGSLMDLEHLRFMVWIVQVSVVVAGHWLPSQGLQVCVAELFSAYPRFLHKYLPEMDPGSNSKLITR